MDENYMEFKKKLTAIINIHSLDTDTNMSDRALASEIMDLISDIVRLKANPEHPSYQIIRSGRLAELHQAEAELNFLHMYGVDNWDGYSEAMEMCNGESE